ncbi:hypothetical protein GCM10007392_28830 [Saccharospirillum salsuginis]|uniref:Uncharacterized protein n=2 Tax=Saccharospirillum salsuginis TaxID=418750 RepID=A0A918NC09_9GAMM|nr:hypothetical protein GCM10007392_28830 [Saccharospirillum salsuginis]
MGAVSLAYANTGWPEPECAEGKHWLEFAEVAFCFNRDDIQFLNYLNLSSPSMQINFNPETNAITQMSVGRLDEQQTTGGLHDQLGLSVRDMFVDLTTGVLSKGPDKEIVNTILTVDAATDFRHYQKAGLDAFVILRKSSMWDAIFIVDEKREGSIHLTGQFQPADVEWLLARLRW